MKNVFMLQVVLLFAVISSVSSESCSWYGDLRLVSGPNEGRVEICIGGEWGTICDSGWNHADAKVACRQLGFEVDSPNGGAITYRHNAYYGAGSGPIFLSGLNCRGTESTLLECGYRNNEVGNIYRYCYHGDDAGVVCPSTQCTHGDVRLAGGLVPTEGRVEVCNSGRWTAVCDSDWNYQDAFVVCRQLGYPATEALPFSNAYFGLGVNVHLTSFLCYGNESHLLDCDHSTTSSCSRRDSAGVRCLGEIISASQCFDGNILHVDGAVRLVGGEEDNEGRVEICSNGLWGSVCSTSWDSRDATVVCRQLGFQNPVAYPYTFTYFGAGTGPILLRGANCAGTEARLQDCQSGYSPVYCYHGSDVGVRCAHSEYSGCSRGEIRLVGGQSEYEGRVEICINGVWGSVCWNRWDYRDARVVCRHIGLPFQLATAVRVTSFYGESMGPFHLTNVGCGGGEENLLDCRNSSVHTCSHGQEAGVKCEDQADCSYGDARLVGGETFYEGRVEVCIDSYWVPVCIGYYRNWDEDEPRVICRQITGEHNPRASIIRRAERIFGQPSSQLQLYFSDDRCNGSEQRLVECSHLIISSSFYFYHRDIAGVICYVSSNCSNGTVHLVDGETETQGRVEICQNGTWWAVSDSQWGLNDAIVVCRHLRYPFTWVLPLSSSFFGRGNSTVLIQDLGCFGNESVVDDCSPTFYSIRSRYYYRDILSRVSGVAGVVCAGNETSQPECQDGELRLVGGQSRNEGRVEVCEDGFWATICDEDWGQREAMVVCRQAGLPTTGALPVRNATYGNSAGPVIAGVSCTGTEATLLECTWETKMNCNPIGRSAGAICQDAYTVTVTSDPPEGPFLLGSTVILHCSVDPAPPQTVSYIWRDSVSSAVVVSVNSTSPNATLTIPMGHPHEARYFCWAQSSDGGVFGVGVINIRVKGFLHPIGDTDLQLTPPQSISMRINITSLQFAGRYFRSLTWYHNGVEVSPANDQRVTVSSDNMTLTIENSTEADAGVYEAKFTGLLVQPYSEICEKETLALVRHYPLASAAVFYVNTQGGTYARESHRQSSGFTISFQGTDYQHPLTLDDTISLTVSSSIQSTLLRNFVSISWYHNGYSLPSGAVTGDLNKASAYISQSLKVENSTIVDSGITEAVLQLQSVYSYLYQFSCPNDYTYFITHSSRGGIGVIVLDQTSIHFKYYEPPTVSVHPSGVSLKPGEHASFLCRAEGGYPHTHTISWIKNGEVIANGTMLDVTTALTAMPFGQYTCVVNNSVITRQETALVTEEGNMEIQLDLHSGNDNCTRWNETTQQENIDLLFASMTKIIQEHCMCSFSTSDFQETNATCSDDGNSLSVNVVVTYSSASGLTTTSDVIEILRKWVQNTPSATFVLGGRNVSASQFCTPCMCTEEQQPRNQAFYQLRVGPVHHCQEWMQQSEMVAKVERSIRRAVAAVIAKNCNCSFSIDYIAIGTISCTSAFLNQIVYRSAILPGSIHPDQAVGTLQEWVGTSSATIDTKLFILTVDSTCAVRIESLNDPPCNEPDTICPDDYSLVTRDFDITSTARQCLNRVLSWPHILGQGCTPQVGRKRPN